MLVAEKKRHYSSIINLRGIDVVLVDLILKEVHISIARIFICGRYIDIHVCHRNSAKKTSE